jgi:hypothetical protein
MVTEIIFGLAILGLYVGLFYLITDNRKTKLQFFAALAETEQKYANLRLDRSEINILVANLRTEIRKELTPFHEDLKTQRGQLDQIKGMLEDAVEKLARIRT